MSENKELRRMDNYNTALVTNWQVSFHKFFELEYFAQSVIIPSLSVSGIPVDYRNRRAMMPDNKIDFGQLTISFIVDEDFKNYDRLFQEFMLQEVASRGQGMKIEEVLHDLTVTRLSSNNVPIARFNFKGCSLTSLGSINYVTNGNDSDQVLCDVSFNVSRMEIENLRKSNLRDDEVIEH